MDNAQELIQRLNHSGKKLSKSHRRIAECIVTHYDKVVFMTASKLGEYVGVSESTVVRFAAALGYSGYPQLQKALQELIRHRLTASQRFEMTSDMDHAQVLNKVQYLRRPHWKRYHGQHHSAWPRTWSRWHRR